MNFIKGTVKWGIIGVGDVCEKKSGPAFARVPDSQLVAVMRRDPEKAEDYARRHKVPRYYHLAEDLIGDKEVNAIYVATPPAFHEEYASAAARAGKLVYIEKPVTLNAAGCERLIALSKKLEVPMAVAHYRRRLPLFLKVKELIEAGAIGKVNLIILQMLQPPWKGIIAEAEVNWRVDPEISGGGLFHDLAPHQLDILCWLFGEPLITVGSSKNQGKRYPAPDVTQLQAIFSNNILLNGIWSFNICKGIKVDQCEIHGENGKISFAFFRRPLIKLSNGKRVKKMRLFYPSHVQQPLIAEVVQFFRGNVPNPSPLEEALWSMRMMDKTL